MKVHQIQVGGMLNFTYVIEDEKTGQAVLLDPSWDLDRVKEVITRNSLEIKYIINTHHHFDHTMGNETMARHTGAKVVQHEESELHHDMAVKDGDAIRFGDSQLLVHHTPGHSRDSICLTGDGKIFSGDTLFVGNCGRVDLPGGSAQELYHSLFGVLYAMPDDLELFPGHNYGSAETSTLGREKRMNPVMRRIPEQEFVSMMGQ